jgi:major membrane immunogen (membrane-anchored lipoprotein)
LKIKLALVAILAVVALAGCGKKEVGFDTLETARKQAKENAEFNARAWRAQTTVTADFGIISRGDSSQTAECPQGDGWASIDLIDTKTAAVKVKMKCSTVSDSVSCRTETDFKSSPYAQEDGRCQSTSKVPFPLPKIAK